MIKRQCKCVRSSLEYKAIPPELHMQLGGIALYLGLSKKTTAL